MRYFAAILTFGFGLMLPGLTIADEAWGSLKGTVVVKGNAPAMPQIVPMPNRVACNANGPMFEETWIVHPLNKGLKNVVVWIEPAEAKRGAPFPVEKIHPKLAKPAADSITIDIPCCQFFPHVSVAREGQNVIIRNSSTIQHNPVWTSFKPPAGALIPTPLLNAGGQRVIANVQAEKFPVALSCSIHPWMNATVFVLDHPYWAITDSDGKFTIENVPTGKFSVYYLHDSGYKGGRAGAQGDAVELKAKVNDLKIVEFPVP